ncbi:Arsb [Symbiodinium sp. KB8]|nr:Arsb [Symbiodinium sp. KB8]
MFEEFAFRDRILSIVDKHNFSQNLFLLYTPHVAHCPLQVPQSYLDAFDFMGDDESACSAQTPYIFPGSSASDFKCRQQYHSMVNLLDDNLRNITDALKRRGVWNETLMVFSSDNGGPIVLPESGSNNHPLRGSKYSEFEGGVRAAAFASGGWLPRSVQGTRSNELAHVADWYTTFSKLVGVDPADPWAKQSGLPPVDGLDLTDLLTSPSGQSPHVAIPVTDLSYIKGNYKLIVSKEAGFASWAGERFPNSSSSKSPVEGVSMKCGDGCLFDVVEDPTEHHELSASMPEKVQELMADYLAAKQSFFTNNDTGVMSCPPGISMPCACWMVQHKYGGFFGPYQEVTV